jgi:hypothetical protein
MSKICCTSLTSLTLNTLHNDTTDDWNLNNNHTKGKGRSRNETFQQCFMSKYPVDKLIQQNSVNYFKYRSLCCAEINAMVQEGKYTSNRGLEV